MAIEFKFLSSTHVTNNYVEGLNVVLKALDKYAEAKTIEKVFGHDFDFILHVSDFSHEALPKVPWEGICQAIEASGDWSLVELQRDGENPYLAFYLNGNPNTSAQ